LPRVGYGSQALALKYLEADFEHHKICEWAIPSIIAYADAHRNELPDYGKDFTKDLNKMDIVQKLFEMGVSADYNQPAKLEQLKRMGEDKLRLIYNSIIWEHNLVDVSRAKGESFGITDTDKYDYILTYSFPCQDLSLAGRQAGMEKGSGTRSGLLWEVERILSECAEIGYDHMPKILVMENVPQVHGSSNDRHFKEWQLRLEELGYQSYWEDLSAVEFKIPQTRNRTFMVSILNGKDGEKYNYNFPRKSKLELRLKDLLEPEGTIPEKFYISDDMFKYIVADNDKWTGNNGKAIVNKSIASTINTGEGSRRCDASNYVSDELPDDCDLKAKIQEEMNLYEMGIKRFNRRTGVVLNPNGSMTTLLARKQGDNSMILEEPRICASRGRNPENPNSRAKGEHLEQRIELGPEGVSNTLTTVQKDNYVITPSNKKGLNNKALKETLEKTDLDKVDDVAYLDAYNKNTITDGTAKTITTGVDFRNNDFLLVKEPNKVIKVGNYSPSNHNAASVVDSEGSAPTVMENHGTVTATVVAGVGDKKSNGGTQWYQQDRIYDGDGVAISVTTSFNPYYTNNYRIRKLLPLECFRLQGVKDVDSKMIMEHQSDAWGWHLTGDSICVSVLMGIFGKLLDKNWEDYFNYKEWWKNGN